VGGVTLVAALRDFLQQFMLRGPGCVRSLLHRCQNSRNIAPSYPA
jgi:hypothetical protein